MKTLIIYCHPYEKSFNHAILETVKDNLRSKKIDYQVIDLYADNFNPTYDKKTY